MINKNDLTKLTAINQQFSFAITSHMYQHIDKTNSQDPIAKQFIPSLEEAHIMTSEQSDPVGDDAHSPMKGIIHRYPDRCLFTPILICPVYCRFCFRKEKVGKSSATLSPLEIQNALNYIKSHSEIWEVILTGGDPFILKPKMLQEIIKQLSAINHVAIIRFHTRIPIVDPERITQEFIAAMQSTKAIYVILHANHPQEFTHEALRACASLIDAGIPMLSQTVLLKNLNDNIDTLSNLMRCLVQNRIKPYYLHHADLVRGTKHFRTNIAHGQQLVKQLRGRFSGLCQPTYVLDIPGGYGKMPIGPNYFELANEDYVIEDFQGQKHLYPKED